MPPPPQRAGVYLFSEFVFFFVCAGVVALAIIVSDGEVVVFHRFRRLAATKTATCYRRPRLHIWRRHFFIAREWHVHAHAEKLCDAFHLTKNLQ